MEKDDEIRGDGNSHDFGARMYDPRVGRWLSRDPLEAKYPHVSTYNFCFNSPIVFVDIDGEEAIVTVQKNESGGGTITISSDFYVVGPYVTDEKIEKFQQEFDAVIKNGTYTDVEGNTWDIVFDMTFKNANLPDNSLESVSKYRESLKEGDNILITSMGGRGCAEQQMVGAGHIAHTPEGPVLREYYFTHTGNVAKGDIVGGQEGIHESMHLLGLTDRYYSLKGVSVPKGNYSGDVMASVLYYKQFSQSHYDNYGRVFAGEEGTFTLKYNVDVNLDTGETVGDSKDGLTEAEKAAVTAKVSSDIPKN